MEYIVYIYNILACNYNKYENALIPFKKAPLGYFFIFYDLCINIFYPYIPHLKRIQNFYLIEKKTQHNSSWGHLKTEDTCDIALWEIVTSRR